MSTDDGAQGRGGGAQPPDFMVSVTNAVKSDPSGLMFVCLEFEVAAAYRFLINRLFLVPRISYGYMTSVSSNL